MRTAPRPQLSDHRLARLNAWLRLWLVWFVGLCVPWWSDDRARQLDRVAFAVASLVVLNATRRLSARALRPSGNRHGRLNLVRPRTVIGSRLRRALRAGIGAGA
jgi:hypothetical protein